MSRYSVSVQMSVEYEKMSCRYRLLPWIESYSGIWKMARPLAIWPNGSSNGKITQKGRSVRLYKVYKLLYGYTCTEKYFGHLQNGSVKGLNLNSCENWLANKRRRCKLLHSSIFQFVFIRCLQMMNIFIHIRIRHGSGFFANLTFATLTLKIQQHSAYFSIFVT